MKPKILFLVRSLERGGAERQLVTLAVRLSELGLDVLVAVFYGGGIFEDHLRRANIRVVDLRKGGRWNIIGFLGRFFRVVIRERPAVVHGYLTVSNILSLLSRIASPGVRVVWGVRASNMDLNEYEVLDRFAYWLECRLSFLAHAIICNSNAGARYARDGGFPEEKLEVIHNGIDTTAFIFSPDLRARQREKWGLGVDDIVFGIAARLDPMKDHKTFLKAASIVVSMQPNARFVCVGEGAQDYRGELLDYANTLGIGDRVLWEGASDDMVQIYSGLDICCSSSAFGEGFSNAIAEAMACMVPCVVTDVGDSAFIVGDTGIVVPPSAPEGLAKGMLEALTFGLDDKKRCRDRITSNFSIDRLGASTLECLSRLNS